MRILHLFSDWKWTGPADPALSLASRLAERGHEVFFACASPPHPVEDSLGQRAAAEPVRLLEGLHLHKHFSLLGNVEDVFRLKDLIREHGISLVHAHRDQDHLIGGAAMRLALPGGVVVRTNHDAVPMSPVSVRKRLLGHRFTDMLIEVSRNALEADRRTFGLDEQRSAHIETAVDLERFRSPNPKAVRNEMGLADDDVVLGIVARVQKRRRFHILFEAFRRALEKNRHLKLVIVGRGTHFDDVAARPIERMGISSRVVTAGYRRQDYAAVLASFDAKIFLVPGTDGSCRAVREAMAAGVPVIASRRGILPELVEEGTGLLVEDEPGPLSEAMLALSADPDLRRELGEGARRAAWARFEPDHQTDLVEKAYEAALARNKPQPLVVTAPAGTPCGPDPSIPGPPKKKSDEASSMGEWADLPGQALDRGQPETAPPTPPSARAILEAEHGPARKRDIDVSVLLVNWNGCHLLEACIDSVREHAGDLATEIILVDNGSTDGSVAFVQERYPDVTVRVNPVNRGFGAANNQAFALATGRKILLLNTDARLEARTLPALSTFLDETAYASAVTPALVGSDGAPQNAFDNIPTLATELFNKGLLRLLFPRKYPHKRQVYDAPLEVESALGACLLCRREAFDQVKGFDEDYFLFLEETDLCLRMRQAGWKVFFDPRVRAIHLGGGSKSHARAEAWIEYYRSLYLFFSKHAVPWAYVILRGGRFFKLFANLLGTFLILFFTMGMHEDGKRRFPVYVRLLAWHLKACPDSEGLKPR